MRGRKVVLLFYRKEGRKSYHIIIIIGEHQMLWSNVIVYILLACATARAYSLVTCCLLSCLSHSLGVHYAMFLKGF